MTGPLGIGPRRTARPAFWVSLALLLGAPGCSTPPPSGPPPPAPSVLRVGGEPLELKAVDGLHLALRQDLEALVLDGRGKELVLHLVLTAPGGADLGGEYRYCRPPGLPPEAEGDSWLKAGRRSLDFRDLRARVSDQGPAGVAVDLEGTVLEGGRSRPVEGRLRVQRVIRR